MELKSKISSRPKRHIVTLPVLTFMPLESYQEKIREILVKKYPGEIPSRAIWTQFGPICAI